MLTLRKSSGRFHTKINWLDSWHSFSFGEHYDPAHLGFGPLRVINEDRVKGGAGFPTHGHRDMEIITVVLKGALEHKDNAGGGSIIRPGDVQKMSAGSGIMHSEFNASKTEEVHLLQIWIMPNVESVKPGYVQLHFGAEQMRNRFCLVAAGGAKDGIIPLYQDARLLIADASPGARLDYEIEPGRIAWVQLASGEVGVNASTMHAGDGLAAKDERRLNVTAKAESKMLLFDMMP
jgi:redox-sensitive bicupin YhaK (pirin superfamily)